MVNSEEIQGQIMAQVEKDLDERCKREADAIIDRAALEPLVLQYLQDTRGVFIVEVMGQWKAWMSSLQKGDFGTELGRYSHKSKVKVIDWALKQPIQVAPESIEGQS